MEDVLVEEEDDDADVDAEEEEEEGSIIFRFLPLCFSELFVYIVMSLCFGIELFDPTGG